MDVNTGPILAHIIFAKMKQATNIAELPSQSLQSGGELMYRTTKLGK